MSHKQLLSLSEKKTEVAKTSPWWVSGLPKCVVGPPSPDQAQQVIGDQVPQEKPGASPPFGNLVFQGSTGISAQATVQ